MDGEKSSSLQKHGGVTNMTLKGCVPFLDAMTAGYMLTLPFDIEVRKDGNGGVMFNWNVDVKGYVGFHPPIQTMSLPSPHGALAGAYKWTGQWEVHTPKGYSCLFMHPLNREDLPFRVLSGIVDTDGYKITVQIPFNMLDFDGDVLIIERGTPIAQIIPFKREDWTSSVGKFDQDALDKKNFTLYSRIVKSYKKQFWKKKNYN